MRSVIFVDVQPALLHIDPCLNIVVEFEYEPDSEARITIQGELKLGDRVLGTATERPSTQRDRLSGRGSVGTSSSRRRVMLAVPLSPRALSAIADARDARLDGDVELALSVWTQTFEVQTYAVTDVAFTSQAGAPPVAGRLVDGASGGNVTLVTLPHGRGMVVIEWVEHVVPVVILSSRWAQVFAPAFGLGRVLVFEYAVPDTEVGDGPLADLVQLAAAILAEMERAMGEGDWTAVVGQSRKVAELFKKRKLEIEQVLAEDGVFPGAAAGLTASLQGLFDYASKFAHVLATDGSPLPPMKAEKEDAHLSFATATTVVNVLSAKMRRAARRAR